MCTYWRMGNFYMGIIPQLEHVWTPCCSKTCIFVLYLFSRMVSAGLRGVPTERRKACVNCEDMIFEH